MVMGLLLLLGVAMWRVSRPPGTARASALLRCALRLPSPCLCLNGRQHRFVEPKVYFNRLGLPNSAKYAWHERPRCFGQPCDSGLTQLSVNDCMWDRDMLLNVLMCLERKQVASLQCCRAPSAPAQMQLSPGAPGSSGACTLGTLIPDAPNAQDL